MSKYENLRAESQSLLESNILPFWATRMVDNERGGFYGRIDGHNILHPDAPKGAVLNARAKSLEYAASDRAAFLEQKNEANGRKTMKSYLRKVCGDLYDAQHQG